MAEPIKVLFHCGMPMNIHDAVNKSSMLNSTANCIVCGQWFDCDVPKPDKRLKRKVKVVTHVEPERTRRKVRTKPRKKHK